MDILYEDNHIIVVNKAVGEIVQGDKTGDRTLADEVKAYIKDRMVRDGEVSKIYHAIVCGQPPEEEATLTHYLSRNERQNKAYAHAAERPGTKRAVLDYKLLSRGERYSLLEVNLHTGRHHQIRCQLATIGCPVKGDLKYGAPRSNPDGGISLHARSISFEHPVSHEQINVVAPYPQRDIWNKL